jgi:hypothetical protein
MPAGECGLAGVEQHLVDQVDAELVADPLDLDRLVGDLVLELGNQLVLGVAQGEQLLLLLLDLRRELGSGALELVADDGEVGDLAPQARELLAADGRRLLSLGEASFCGRSTSR